MMERHELQTLRQLPIEQVAQRMGMRVARHKALCPFHDDHHESLSFSVSRNTFCCFACGAKGGTIDLVMRYLNKGFSEACRWLARDCGQTLAQDCGQPGYAPRYKTRDWGQAARFFEHPWLNEEARRFLFDERRIDERVARWCRLNSWRDGRGVNWLQTPYYDLEGRLTGVQYRNLVKGALPRFRFPCGSECGIYNLPVIHRLRLADELYITEGCSDCWAMLSAGRKAVAIPSATLLKLSDAQLLRRLAEERGTTFHMYPDSDAPGERLFMQLKQVLPTIVRHQLPPGCKDFGEMYAKRNVEH